MATLTKLEFNEEDIFAKFRGLVGTLEITPNVLGYLYLLKDQ